MLGLPRGAGVYGLHDRGGVREMGSVGLGWAALSRSCLEGVCAANWIGSFRPWLHLSFGSADFPWDVMCV